MREKTRLTHINKRMLLTLLLVTGASCLLAFSRFYIFGDRVLVFKDIGSDTAQQYLALYASISEKIRSGDWTLWNVDNGFGVNMYMCNLFNPLLWILYVVGAIFGFSPVPQMLVWWFMLEILLAALCAYVYLSVFDLPEIAKGIAAYIYAFNGFLIVWGQHYQFGIICIILPLLLWSVERYFRDSSKWPLMTIMTAVVVFNSMYLAYMSLLMTGFYVVLRILMHENNRPLKYIRRVVAAAIPMFLGVFIGMVSLLPSYIAIKSASNRLDGGMDWGNFLIHMIDRYPNLYFKTALDRLMSSVGEGISLFHGFLNYYEAPALFFSGLFIILLFQYIFSIPVQKVSLKSKILQVVFLVLTAGVMYFINIGTILNGFTAPFCRFTFLLMPYFLLIVAFAMKRILEEKKINLIALLAAALMMAWRGRIILLSDWHNPKKVLLMSFAACGMMVICLGILRFVKQEKSRRIVLIALLLFLFVNVSAETYGNFGARDTLLKDDEYFEDVEDPDTLEALAMIQAEDQGLYRIEKMYGASFCVDAMYQNYQGVSTYNSVQNGNIQELVDSDWTQIRYLDQNHISFRKGPGNMPENELAGIRYVLSESDCLILGDYKVWKQVGHIYIYKNDTIDGICSYYDENDVTVVDQDEIKVKQSKLDQEADLDFNKQLRDDRVDGKVTASEDGYLIIAYPFESGWKAYVDGQEVETFKANKAYQAVKLSAGTHEVALRFYCPLVRESLIVTLVSLLIFAGTWVYSARKRRTACKSSTK